MRTLWGLVLCIVVCFSSSLFSSENSDRDGPKESMFLECPETLYVYDVARSKFVTCDTKSSHAKCPKKFPEKPNKDIDDILACIFVSRYTTSRGSDGSRVVKPNDVIIYQQSSVYVNSDLYNFPKVPYCIFKEGSTICYCFNARCTDLDKVKTKLLQFENDGKKRLDAILSYQSVIRDVFLEKDPTNYPCCPSLDGPRIMPAQLKRTLIYHLLDTEEIIKLSSKASYTTDAGSVTDRPDRTTSTTPKSTIEPAARSSPGTTRTTTISSTSVNTKSVRPATTSPGPTGSPISTGTSPSLKSTDIATTKASRPTKTGIHTSAPIEESTSTTASDDSSREETIRSSMASIKQTEQGGWAVVVNMDEKNEVWEENEKCNRTNVMLGDDGYYKVCNARDSSEQCPHMDAVPRFRTSDDEVLICVSIWHHNSHQERHPKDPRCVPGDTSKPVLEVRPMKMKRKKAQNLMKECRYSTKSVICSCHDHICENLRNLENFFYEEMGRRPAMESGYNPKAAEFPEAKRQVLSFCIYQELVDMTHEPFSFANWKPRKPRSRSVLLIVKALSVIVIFIVAVLLGCIGICKMWKSYCDIAYLHYLNTEQRRRIGTRQRLRRIREGLMRKESEEKEKESKVKKEEEVDKGKIEKKETGVVKEGKGKESKAKKEEEVDKGKIEKKETEVVKEGKGKESKVKDGEKKKEKKREQKGSKQNVEKKEEKKEVIKKESKEKKEEKEKGPKVEGTPKKEAKERKVEEPKVEKKNKKAKKEKKRRAMTDDDRTMEVSVTGRVHSSSSS